MDFDLEQIQDVKLVAVPEHPVQAARAAEPRHVQGREFGGPEAAGADAYSRAAQTGAAHLLQAVEPRQA